MDSYTTDAVSLAKKISVHSSVTISAVVRVITDTVFVPILLNKSISR